MSPVSVRLRDVAGFSGLPWKCLPEEWDKGPDSVKESCIRLTSTTQKALLKSGDAIEVIPSDAAVFQGFFLTGEGINQNSSCRQTKALADPLLRYVLVDILLWLDSPSKTYSPHPKKQPFDLLAKVDRLGSLKNWGVLISSRRNDLLVEPGQQKPPGVTISRFYTAFLNGTRPEDAFRKLEEELAQDTSQLRRLAQENGWELNGSVIKKLAERIDTWQQALLLALLVSPICLLAPVDFSNARSIARWKSLKAFLSFGGSKPPSLQEAEYALYGALYQIVNGALAEDAVRDACVQLADVVNSLSPDDASWFLNCGKPENNTPLSPHPTESLTSLTPSPLPTPTSTLLRNPLGLLGSPPNSTNIGDVGGGNVGVGGGNVGGGSVGSGKEPEPVMEGGEEPEPHTGEDDKESESEEDGEEANQETRQPKRLRARTVTSPGAPPKVNVPVQPPRKKLKTVHNNSKDLRLVNQSTSSSNIQKPSASKVQRGNVKQNPWEYEARPTAARIYEAQYDCTQRKAPQGILSLSPTPQVKIIHSKIKFKLWAADGISIEYQPAAHSPPELSWQETILGQVVKGYGKEERPAFLSTDKTEKASSAMHIITREAFNKAVMNRDKDLQMQDLFKTKNIVILGSDRDFKELDTDIISAQFGGSLCLDTLRELHDLSVKTSNRSSERYRLGTFLDIAQDAGLPKEQRRLMNVLSIPLKWATADEPGLQTHEHARRTDLKDDDPLMKDQAGDLSGLFWGLVCTDGTFHMWHVDANGFATFIDVHSGYKLWIIAYPNNPAKLADPKFTAEFKVNRPAPEDWKVEAILLAAGDGLRMQPFLPHAVITPKAALCTGGHYISKCTLRRTVYGILQCFSTSSVTTNTEHTDTSTFLVGRITSVYHELFTTFYLSNPTRLSSDLQHLPNIQSFDGMIDLLMLLNLCELSNVLHFRTYRANVSALSPLQLDRMIEARRRARLLRNWLWRHFELRDKDKLVLNAQTLYWDLLAGQCRALVFHNHLVKKEMKGDALISGETLQNCIEHTFSGNNAFKDAWERNEACVNYGYQGPAFTVEKSLTDLVVDDTEEDGMTAMDRAWKQKV
ncbi:hypothetical protein BDN72DRAFT_863022 [Pluteus cervinus]|uniref:Uncharacterized protein n=1 Tax=Pluteus cervinus TaxID=181527 RepID=A0ACD3A9B3_9AGAR|nr:hypothetical protein BDN72DRAFT_863022 [Pluteus cervinus]